MNKRIKTIEAFQRAAKSLGKTYAELQQEETAEIIREQRKKEAGYADVSSNRKRNR